MNKIKTLALGIFISMLVACACNDNASPTIPVINTTNNGNYTGSTEQTYVAEVGYICEGFNFGAVTQSKATEGYIAMYSICGDMSTMSTGTVCETATVITNWMKSLNITAFDQVNTDIYLYGSSFRWYNAVDGYERYIYIEPCGDGKGLLKK